MHATKQTFSKIIQSDTANEHYQVPKYQRAYSWRLNNWEALYDDLDENEPGHFIGSIICINDNQAHIPGNDIVYELIDGQQRLTTLSLLLAAVHCRLDEYLKEMEDELNKDEYDEDEYDELKAKKRSISKQLIRLKKSKSNYRDGFKDGKRFAFYRVQPSTQNSNFDDYKYILYDAGVLLDEPPKPHYLGNRLMHKAYGYFYERLPKDIEKFEDFIRKINQIILVHISVDTHSNAFKLFETLNNRGIPLTAVDIIKNKMLAEMERQHGMCQ